MKNKKSILVPYITAGFPTTKLFEPVLKLLSENGADFIEIGVPHSDPLADGPVIQQSSKIAIENGVNLPWIVNVCKKLINKNLKPLILFSYFNPIQQYGLEKLLNDLPKPLFYGLIIPDLPLEESEKYFPIFKKHALNLILLAAPTSKKEKIKKIANASQGFIYLVSVTGTTGVRSVFSSDLRRKIKEIKSYTDKPVVIGFGISKLEQAKKILSYGADGIIIGSALIKLLGEGKRSLAKVKNFISKLA